MLRYASFRLLGAIPTIFAVLTVVFFAMRILPGDPAVAILGDNAGIQQIEIMRERLGLNEPILSQYFGFLRDLTQIDLGRSLANNIPVTQLLREHFPYTLELTVASMFVGALIGIPIGVLSAIRRNTGADYASRAFALSGLSIPDFFLGFLLLLLFGLHLRWAPLMGAGDGVVDRLHHLILPALALGLVKSAFLMRMTRSAVLEVLRRDYVRMAISKGLSSQTVVWRHVLRNAMVPVITAFGISAIATLAGSISIELVFSRPGIGRLLVGAISARDYTLVQGTLALFAVLVVVVNLIVDLIYALIDPRISL